MKTDEIQAASSAAAGSLATDARRPMGATGGTGRWSASVLRWRRAAAVGSSTLDPSPSKWLRWDFGTVRVVLAAVLLVAAALKSEQLWETSPQPFSSPTFALIVFEFAFAAWLLTGWLPRVTWWLAVGCFTAFALAALGKLLQGESDCGCFGAAPGGLPARGPVHSLALRAGIVALARRLPRSGWLVEAGQVVVILLVALLVLNWGYVFDRTLLPLSTYENYFEDIIGREVPEALRKMPVPLPENYVRGMWEINRVMEHGHRSFLAGQWRDRGWWYYYLYGMVVKNPLGMLGLVAMALVVGRATSGGERAKSGEQRAESKEGRGERGEQGAKGNEQNAKSGDQKAESSARSAECSPLTSSPSPLPPSRDELFVLVPGIAFLAFVSYFSNMSHHFRYAMPFLPFCFIYAGRAARYVTHGPRVLGGLVVVCWTAAVIGSLWNWPHSLSYFNELAGGPIGGRQHLINSSLDWGQDLLFLKRWLEAHPEARPLNLVYFGGVDPRLVGIEYQLPEHLRRGVRGVRSGEVGVRRGEERVESGEMLSRSESRQSAGGFLRSTPATRPRPSATSGRATHFPDQQRPPPGWYAISVNYVMGTQGSAPDGQGNLISLRPDAFSYFQQLTPVARAGYSIDIYHVEQQERVRSATSEQRKRERSVYSATFRNERGLGE